MPTKQQNALIQDALLQAKADSDVIGLMLQGSLARGDGYASSDLDLFFLLKPGLHRPFEARTDGTTGILIEHHLYDLAKATEKVSANPMLAYGFTGGLTLYDANGEMAALVATAQTVLSEYRTPPDVYAGIRHWLLSSRVKIAAARDGGDPLKAAFVASTTAWKILEGVWAANDMPMPPSGAVLYHRHDLTKTPDNWSAVFDHLFLGDTDTRIEAALIIIDWFLNFSTHKFSYQNY